MSRRNWCFTINALDRFCNDPTVADDDFGPAAMLILKERLGLESDVKCCVYQLEEAASQHLQGYIELRRPYRMPAVKDILECQWAHLEPRAGSRLQAMDYCSKLDTRVPNTVPVFYPSQAGCAIGQGSRSDLKALQAFMDEGATITGVQNEFFGHYLRYHKGIEKYKMSHTERRNRKIEVILWLGPPGCGKSHSVNEAAPTAYWKPPNNKWFDGYDGEKIVVFDDFSGGWFDRATLLQLLHEYPLVVETKGGGTQFVAETVHITCNFGPESWYSKGPATAIYRRIDVLMLFDSMNEGAPGCSFTRHEKDQPYGLFEQTHASWPNMWWEEKFE